MGDQMILAFAGTIAVALSDFYDSLQETCPDVIHATRAWIQYGTVGFAIFCILIGALEALVGR